MKNARQVGSVLWNGVPIETQRNPGSGATELRLTSAQTKWLARVDARETCLQPWPIVSFYVLTYFSNMHSTIAIFNSPRQRDETGREVKDGICPDPGPMCQAMSQSIDSQLLSAVEAGSLTLSQASSG